MFGQYISTRTVIQITCDPDFVLQWLTNLDLHPVGIVDGTFTQLRNTTGPTQLTVKAGRAGRQPFMAKAPVNLEAVR